MADAREDLARRDRAMCAAVAWHLRLAGGCAEDWQAFTAWLEADPAHARAYEAMSVAEAELDDALALNDWSVICPAIAANDRYPVRRGRWKLAGGGGLVAAGVAALLLWSPSEDQRRMRFVETPPGVPRTIRLVDGTRIELNGGTRIGIDDASGRLASLERGEAVFRVAHDENRPFVVESGGTRLQDVGTTFNLARVGPQVTVQVAEGAVLFQPQRDRIMLTAGAALSHVDGEPAHMSGIAVEDVGSWQKGRLVFRQTPLHLVVAALERSTGSGIEIARGMREMPFTGSLRLAGGADLMVPRFAALVGARAIRQQGRWTLVHGANAGP